MSVSNSPPRAPPTKYTAHYGTRWQKEKAAAGQGAFEYPEDAKYVGPWIIGECVGKGASGHVKIARHRRTGQLAAIKILPLELVFNSRTSLKSRQAKSDKQRLGIDREIIMMKLMNHPNIMRIYDVYEGDNELYLILEYIEGGELFDFLVNRGKLPPLEALAYFKQIIYGLNYAHAFSIIHRDLKPENILIHSLNPPLIKIADWGMAAFAPPTLQLETSCGSPHYASPEIVNGHKYNGTATDIWSCGVILFALLTGRLPFDDKNVRTLLSKVKTGKYDIPNFVDPQAKDLLTRMLVVDVKQRISIPDILAHPWMSQDTPGILYVPAPSVTELARPLRSLAHIDADVLESLCVIWGRYADTEKVKLELLSPTGDGLLAKAFYFLLQKHREQTLEEHGILMDVDEIRVTPGEKAITKLYMSPLSKKARPVSLNIETSANTFSLVPPPMERNPSAPAALQQPTWPQILSPTATSPSRRSHPISPAGPRVHRPRPISTPAQAHSSFQTGRPTPIGAVSEQQAHASGSRSLFASAPPAPFPPGYAEENAIRQPQRSLPNPFLSPPQSPPMRTAHPYPVTGPGARSSFMLPLTPISGSVPTTAPLPVYAPTPTLPSINAPRISNATFQRTIDDIAGRMNVLNAAFARAQVQARAEAVQGQISRPLPCLVPPPADPQSVPSYRLATMDVEREAPRPSEGSAGDKENVEQVPAGKRHGEDEGPVLSGLGFMRPNGMGLGKEVGNISIGTEQLHRAATGSKKDRKSKAVALDLLDTPRKVLSMSPVLGSPKPSSLLGSPAVGEFKGWFSNLFNWKAQMYALHSFDGAAATRTEARRLLAQNGVAIEQAEGVLRCRVDDAYDPASGALVQKHTRFRIEFAVPPLGPGAKGTYSCTMVLVQEKGSVSTFRAVCQRLKEEWRLDALESPVVGYSVASDMESVSQRLAAA
ncbi:Pkinase-domain-containing protein [Artomyces pyxidatus]|uniref:Pkinase-domain-containing protein n=1 Tax=Artomyces pyxidatus TaxID=48021 RepID=A0ACB8T786_9AGAM|nr:Pkinase-domain-containing protein [Artomyces pyxidatus]